MERSDLHFPRFLVDDGEEVEGVEAEVHGAARGVEQPDFARVFERAIRDEDGLAQKLLLRRSSCWLRVES